MTETTMLDVDDVNLRWDLVKVHGKGDKDRSLQKAFDRKHVRRHPNDTQHR